MKSASACLLVLVSLAGCDLSHDATGAGTDSGALPVDGGNARVDVEIQPDDIGTLRFVPGVPLGPERTFQSSPFMWAQCLYPAAVEMEVRRGAVEMPSMPPRGLALGDVVVTLEIADRPGEYGTGTRERGLDVRGYAADGVIAPDDYERTAELVSSIDFCPCRSDEHWEIDVTALVLANWSAGAGTGFRVELPDPNCTEGIGGLTAILRVRSR